MDLSIIIPAYNAQDYMAACLRSVTRCPQEIEMECIVVDDGSADDTAAIVNRYRARDTRIRVHSKENTGVSDTRNVGLAQATGKYIMFLDADDMLVEDAWELLVPAVQEQYADYMAFSYITLYENGKMTPQMLSISDVISTDRKDALRLVYASSECNTCWGKIFRRDIIMEHNIQFRTDLPIGEDYLFVAEYVLHAKTCYITKAMILYYLQRSGSAMRSYTMEQRLDYTRILYNYNKNIVVDLADTELQQEMQVYYLRVITNLFYEFAKIHKRTELRKLYDMAVQHEVVQEIIGQVQKELIHSGLKKMEYQMLSGKNVNMLCMYYGLKAKF